MRWFTHKVQPKDEHPMQEVWNNIGPSEPPQGGSVTAPSGQSNHYLLVLMKSIESGIVPEIRVDWELIGEDQR